MDITPRQIVKLGGRHCFLKLFRGDHLAKERIGIKQYGVVEEDIVDTNYLLLAQDYVGDLRIAFAHHQADAKVRIVIEIRAGRNYPVYETGFDERNKGRHSQASGR